jgi:hypothetical protein
MFVFFSQRLGHLRSLLISVAIKIVVVSVVAVLLIFGTGAMH